MSEGININFKQVVVALIIAGISATVTFAFGQNATNAKIQERVSAHEQQLRDMRSLLRDTVVVTQENARHVAVLLSKHEKD